LVHGNTRRLIASAGAVATRRSGVEALTAVRKTKPEWHTSLFESGTGTHTRNPNDRSFTMSDIYQLDLYRLEPGEHEFTVWGIGFDYLEKGTRKKLGEDVANVSTSREDVEKRMPLSTRHYYSHEHSTDVQMANNRLVSRVIRVKADEWSDIDG
jgi:hypothetical protein